MKRTLVAALVAGSICTPIAALAAEGDQQSSRAERMEHSAADQETVLDAKLAGMRAGLALTADHESFGVRSSLLSRAPPNRAWTPCGR